MSKSTFMTLDSSKGKARLWLISSRSRRRACFSTERAGCAASCQNGPKLEVRRDQTGHSLILKTELVTPDPSLAALMLVLILRIWGAMLVIALALRGLAVVMDRSGLSSERQWAQSIRARRAEQIRTARPRVFLRLTRPGQRRPMSHGMIHTQHDEHV
jgi:hypothetical protein